MRTIASVLLLIFASVLTGQEKIENPLAPINEAIRAQTPAVVDLAGAAVIVTEVNRQNAQDLSLERIGQLEAEWREQTPRGALKKSIANNVASEHIRRFIGDSKDIFNEIFLVDQRGALVAAYPLTNGYFHGHKEKVSKPYKSGEIYYGPVSFDNSTGVFAAQISVPVRDESGKVIGVLVAGVRLSYVKTKAGISPNMYADSW